MSDTPAAEHTPAPGAQDEPPAGRPRWRRALWAAAFVVWVVAATLVVAPLLFRGTARVGPGTVEVRVGPALHGSTVLAAPPLGSVSADTHAAPVRLSVELRQVDLLDVLDPSRRSVTDPEEGLDRIRSEVADDLGDALFRLAALAVVIGAVTGAVAALVFPGPRTVWRTVGGTALGGATVVLLVAPAAIGYDPTRFEQDPALTGPLSSAPDLLQRLGSLDTPLGTVESRTRVLADKLTDLYSTALTGEIDRSEGEVVLLHVSDLHLNAVGLSLARELADSFGVDAVVDTGDITSFGFEPESGFVDLLEDFEVPYYVVAGNHDSREVRARLARSDAVTLLDGDVVDVGGVRILGVGDPTVTALREIPEERLRRTYEDQFDTTEELVAREDPDLLLVHNPVQITPVVGQVPAAAAGHIHRFELEVRDGTVIAVVGSSGATGLGDLLVESDAPYRFQLLRFVDGELVAVDDIELQGAGGDFDLERRLITDEDRRRDDDSELLEEDVREPSLEEVLEDDPGRGGSTTSTDSTTTTVASGGG